MWRTVQSNRTEKLFQAFARDTSSPPPDPLEPETVVVQDMGMARWLTHRLALTAGVAANIRFLVPADLVRTVYGAWLGQDIQPEAWSRPVLTWRIFRLLPDFLDHDQFADLRRYVSEDPLGLKAYQLAERIATVFDRYLAYRQEMLLSWEEGNGEGWQPVLWRRLVETIGEPHLARLHHRFRTAAGQGKGPLRPEALPRRVSLFGVSHLAPVHLEVFVRLASHLPVTLYYPNPSGAYWGDVETEKQRIRREARAGALTSAFAHEANPLMGSWAQSGRFLFESLQRIHEETEAQEEDLFEEPAPASLLGRVQHDLFHLADGRPQDPDERQPVSGPDASLQVHACHSPMREVQVLHDRIAWMLEHLADLAPEDIVVMAPDIDVYAPYVEAVFGTRDDPRIPWNLSERKAPLEDPLLEKILEMLSLPRRRLTASDVLSLLETPAVAARLDLTPDDLARIRTWVRETGIRWGLDGEQKKEWGLPADPSNTWQTGLDRLFAGYALPPREIFCGRVLAYPHVEAASAQCLGKLQDLLDRIAFWHETLREARPASQWQELLNRLLDDFFFPEGDWEESLRSFRRALDRFRSFADLAHMTEPLSIQVVRAHLSALLEAAPSIRRFLSGGVTFCNLVPMRTIPFRVVCLLGMNDTDFPRMDHPPQFDLAARDPQPGDRLRNREDRFLFLEALLSARDVFYVSYVGRDIRDDSERVPSILVSELLDYVDGSRVLPDGRPPSAEIVVRHPLQPFSRRLYDGSDPRLFSYDRQWLEAARAEEQNETPPFLPDGVLPAAPENPWTDEVDLEDLLRFFENPSRWFLERELGLSLYRAEDPILDEEPFTVAGLDRYRVETDVFQAVLDGADPEETWELLRARGVLPQGTAGKVVFRDTFRAMEAMAETVREWTGSPRKPVEVDLDLGGVRLRGWIPRLTERGLLQVRPAKIKGKDRIRLGIRHLALCAVRPPGIALESVHVARDAVFRLKEVPDPEGPLRTLLDLWREGRERPLPFFPDTSWEFASGAAKGDPEDKVRARCRRTFRDDYRQMGEGFDACVATAFRAKDPLDDDFRRIARAVFDPILQASGGSGK
ncbi:MAG: exodeoxyribonuclease V subunit gamma [Desulfacinum sp.]|jgi:exodeoxyribonuclease V gamma subunit|nr:exodeoxyribonuclease V subunit gamma [Desulfacinum sp.]MBZ4659156.1 exodeoxyribonuclease subunit gamma [Desulfacinum sp.]